MTSSGRIRHLLVVPIVAVLRVRPLSSALALAVLLLLLQQDGVPVAEAHEFVGASLIVQHSGKCMDVAWGSTAPEAKVIQWSCHGGLNQQVDIIQTPDGWHQIKFKHSNMCLDVPYGSQNPGVQLQQYPCNNGDNQKFSVPSCSGCTGPIKNKASGLCVDVYNASTADGAAVIQWGCHSGSNQKWKLALPSCNWTPNWYSMQYVTNVAAYGQFGWFYTYQPSVPSGSFSLSLLYTKACMTCDKWVEVGWAKWPPAHPNATYYSGFKPSGQPMIWDFFGEAPSSRYIAYEIQFEGYSYASETDRWGVYIDNLSSPRKVYNIPDMRAGWPSSGGEVYRVTGTRMLTRATPSHQLKDANNVWHDWNSSYAPDTKGCNDPNFTWTWYRRYDDFYATGTAP